MKCLPCASGLHHRCTDSGCECPCGGLELEWPPLGIDPSLEDEDQDENEDECE